MEVSCIGDGASEVGSCIGSGWRLCGAQRVSVTVK